MGIWFECIKNLLKKPFTRRYPQIKIEPYLRYRGKLRYASKRCIGCRLCEQNCPSKAIVFFEKGRIDFDSTKCITCGLCVDVCPTKAISFATDFESCSSDKKKLIIRT